VIRLSILTLLLACVACNAPDNKTAENSAPVENGIPPEKNDTTIFLRINEIKQSFRIKKDNLKKMVKFQTFLDQYPEIPKLHMDTVSIDLTGDGIHEKIITRIKCNNRDCIIFSNILKDETIVLSDTLMPNDDLAYMDWSEDSIYFKLKPYSTFYDALLKKNRVQELENGKISEDLVDFYTSPLYHNSQEKYRDTTKARMVVDSIKQELRGYKGKYVLTLDHWNRSLLFWNRFTKRFEVLYTP
jgi:hypothetical protein